MQTIFEIGNITDYKRKFKKNKENQRKRELNSEIGT